MVTAQRASLGTCPHDPVAANLALAWDPSPLLGSACYKYRPATLLELRRWSVRWGEVVCGFWSGILLLRIGRPVVVQILMGDRNHARNYSNTRDMIPRAIPRDLILLRYNLLGSHYWKGGIHV